MNLPPDIDLLLERFSANDALVSAALVEGYRAGLYRLAYGMLGDADDAEDALQQTFINAVQHLEHYQRGTHFKAWLYTIAVNACRAALRKRQARRVLDGWLRRSAAANGSSDGPEQSAFQGETARQIWTAVAGLAEKQRLVLLLRFQQELTIAEIAKVLAIPEKTVYSRLYRALSLLRQALASEGLESGGEAVGNKEIVI